jgi:hypothetical protein
MQQRLCIAVDTKDEYDCDGLLPFEKVLRTVGLDNFRASMEGVLVALTPNIEKVAENVQQLSPHYPAASIDQHNSL